MHGIPHPLPRLREVLTCRAPSAKACGLAEAPCDAAGQGGDGQWRPAGGKTNVRLLELTTSSKVVDCAPEVAEHTLATEAGRQVCGRHLGMQRWQSRPVLSSVCQLSPPQLSSACAVSGHSEERVFLWLVPSLCATPVWWVVYPTHA